MTETATRTPELFTPLNVGAVTAPNRVFLAPLTRNRARPDGTPWAHAATYYAQRASAGLMITEATQIAATGKGYLNTPGLHSDAHQAAWAKITAAVHDAGGRIFLQLWHVGRISHVSLLPKGEVPVAPSAIRAKTQTFTENGFEDVSEPRALDTDEIPALVAQYAEAARRAKAAGFDGVEIHGANGYLIDQFLRSGTNRRTDAYGGSAVNRARFLKNVAEAVSAEIGADRTGLRLSPTGAFNDMQDDTIEETFRAAIDAVAPLGLAYLHVVEEFPGEKTDPEHSVLLDRLFDHWKTASQGGIYIANGGFDAARGADWVGRGRADAIAYGRPFLANPDLPSRYAEGAPLNEPDQATFYGGDERGYTDYPFMEDAA